MADKNDFSEVIAEVLIELQAQRQEQQRTNEILTRLVDNTLSRQGFENFANATLDKFDKQEERDNRQEKLLQKIVEDHEMRIQKLESK
jgi:hypothetical protein